MLYPPVMAPTSLAPSLSPHPAPTELRAGAPEHTQHRTMGRGLAWVLMPAGTPALGAHGARFSKGRLARDPGPGPSHLGSRTLTLTSSEEMELDLSSQQQRGDMTRGV